MVSMIVMLWLVSNFKENFLAEFCRNFRENEGVRNIEAF